MKMKKLAAIALSGVLLLSASGCSQGTSSTPPEGASVPPTGAASVPPTKEETGGNPADVKVGILIPGSPTDGGFSQQAAEAGKQLKENYGYTVSVVEAATAETIRQEGETMAAEGYRIVFGHGGQCAAPLAEISPDYPETWFVTTGGDILKGNQFAVSLCLEESTYVAGVIAGLMTQSNVIGYTLGGDYPAYTKTTHAFELGAKSVNPEVEVLGAVLAAPDANECYETTMNQIQAGADIIYSNSNEGQPGAIKAVSESEGVYTFGSLGDFIPQAPTKVIGNTMGDWGAGFDKATKAIMEGAVPNPTEIVYLTMANDCVSFQWNDALKKNIPAEVIEAAEQTLQDIKSGKIDVPNEYELG